MTLIDLVFGLDLLRQIFEMTLKSMWDVFPMTLIDLYLEHFVFGEGSFQST